MTTPGGQNPYPGGPHAGYGAQPPGYGYPPHTGSGPALAPPSGGRTNSKAFPVIVASGLAVGVFSGLLLVRGTGEAAEETGGGGPDVPTVVDAGVPKPADAAVAAKVVDAAPPVVDAAPEPDEPKTATLTFDVSPDDIDDLEITVNDAKVEGNTHEVELDEDGEARVKIIAKADGYRIFTKRLKVKESETVEVSLRKRSSGGGSNRPRPTGPKGPGGLIDLP